MEEEINLVTDREGRIYFTVTILNGIINGALCCKKEDIASSLLKIIKEKELSKIKITSKLENHYNKFDNQTILEEDLKLVAEQLRELDGSRKYYLNKEGK